jgi:threonyl-tRNA synthetase
MVKVTLKDGNVIEVEGGTTVAAVAGKISDGLARVAICASINGRTVDLSAKITADCSLHIYTLKDEIGQTALRHTASHVMAAAVKNIYPTAKLGIGPAIEGGFFYDFDFATPIKADDLSKIEAEMDRIIRLGGAVERKEKSRAEAGRILDAAREVYKIEILNEIPRGEKIGFYKIENFMDLCAGPHLPNLSKIKAFKLTRITGAYWKGDSKNKMLTRIYGVAFDKASDLQDYITTQEEIKKRDHNKIGRDLEIFTTVDCIGQGLPLFMPNGAKLFQILARFVEDEAERRGYLFTRTPFFAKKDLFQISGHWQHYKDDMFIIGNELLDEETFAIRPMTCPFQYFIYKAAIRSYRDMPIRYAETSPMARNENSGEMHGLIRIRQFTQSDCHVICRPDQVQQIFDEVLDLINFFFRALGVENDVTYRLSKGDPNNKEKYIDNPEAWKKSEDELRKVLMRRKLKFYEADNEAAFYGPKIDIQFRNVYGKEDTVQTMQLDFGAADRFDMFYIDANGEKVRPFVVHHMVIGAYERVIAMLIEKYAGALPVWLSPTQAVIMGISNKQDEYVESAFKQLCAAGIRIQKDIRNEKVGYKIREATLKKIPYMLVAGEKEQSAGTVSVRTREGKELGEMKTDEFIEKIKQQCSNYR